MSEHPKPIVLFCSATYYPGGGMSDAVGVFDTLNNAWTEWSKKHASTDQFPHALDMNTGRVHFVDGASIAVADYIKETFKS